MYNGRVEPVATHEKSPALRAEGLAPSPDGGTSRRAQRMTVRGLLTLRRLGQWVHGLFQEVRRLVAFTLITLVTAVQKWSVAPRVIHPLIREQIFRTGVRLLPLICVLGFGLGFIIVGQVLILMIQNGQTKLFSTIIAPLMIREIAPLAAALIVLMRVGTAMVAELGLARATGEVEALEALGIDPIHLLVVPRVIGLTVSVMALTMYLVIMSLLGGYLMGFVRGASLTLPDYFGGVVGALGWLDFPLLGLKTLLLGATNALVICYQGLAQPLRLEQIGHITARTVAQCLVFSLLIDTLFLVHYLIL